MPLPGLAELRTGISLALVLRVALQPGFTLAVGETPLTSFVGGEDEELWVIGVVRVLSTRVRRKEEEGKARWRSAP
jgi:hypothetical protein